MTLFEEESPDSVKGIPMAAEATRPAKTGWQPLEGIQGYTLGAQGKVWKGQKGWWASRKGQPGIVGPFRGYRLAQAWVEEPLAQAREAREQRQAQVREERARQRGEARAALVSRTWGDLPEAERVLAPGQLWEHKTRAGRAAMVLEVRKDTVVALFKSDPALAWKEAARDTVDLRGFLRVYRFKGHEVPKGRKPKTAG
jgi:hypothetical protein